MIASEYIKDCGMNSNTSTRRPASALFVAGSILLAGAWLVAGASVDRAVAQAPEAGQGSDPLRNAFDALPQADRFALQDALVWTGDYKGTIDGVLGRGGVAALSAYAKRANTTPEGVFEAATRKQLLAQAHRLRTAVRFEIVRDGRSGAAIEYANRRALGQRSWFGQP